MIAFTFFFFCYCFCLIWLSAVEEKRNETINGLTLTLNDGTINNKTPIYFNR